MAMMIPFPNRLTDQLHPTGSTIDLLRFDSNLFINLVVPDGITADLVIQCILEKHGMTALFHPDPAYMKAAIGSWSKRRLPIWNKLYKSTILEYNPIENYDRQEDIEESRTTDRTTSGSATGTNRDVNSETRTETEETKRDVSAENASDYQPDAKDTITGGGTVSANRDINTESETSGNENVTDTFRHSNRTHGNIGVTTSQQMIQSEREVARYSVIEEIAEDYNDAFCLLIY